MSRRLGMARWALVALLVGVSACGGAVPRPTNGPTDAAALVAAVGARAGAVRSLSGMLSLEVWRGNERVRLRQLIAQRRPSHLRVDTLTPFEQPVSTLVSDGVTLSIYALDERRFYEGQATAENLARVLQVPVDAEALGALLRGELPLMADAGEPTLSWDGERGQWRLDVPTRAPTDPARRQTLFVEPAANRLAEVVFKTGDTTTLHAWLGDYDGTGATAVPRRLRFEVPARALRVDARLQDHRVNVDLPDEAFMLEAPRGVTIERL